MPAVIMSETSRHYCPINGVISRSKGELHALSPQVFEYAEKNILTLIHTSGHKQHFL